MHCIHLFFVNHVLLRVKKHVETGLLGFQKPDRTEIFTAQYWLRGPRLLLNNNVGFRESATKEKSF
jgi:hypothetical protein